ncbi:hypothetical protein LCGC14_1509210 [marine sediment metagenome]|uniref:Uncharacterized protein n=1 Tax=marine sediment metagenome TaxID=412755 RepID=A0A0F9JMM0_9ZZZZ
MDELQTEDMVRIIKIIKPGLAEKQLVPGMSRFIFTGDDIVTFNGGVCVHHPLQISFKCSVNAEEFIKIINKLKTKTMNLEEKEGHLHLTSGKVRARFSTKAETEKVTEMVGSVFAEIAAENAEWQEIDAEFKKGVSMVTPSASKNRQKGTQCCLHVHENCLMCSDGKRLAIYELEKPPSPFLVEASEISSIVQADVVVNYYMVTESWIHLQDENQVVFSVRKRTGEFPYDHIFKIITEFPTDAIIKLPAEFAKAIDTASIFTEEEGKIDITVNNTEMTCQGKSITGEVSYLLDDFSYDGEEFTFPVNQSWIVEVLKGRSEMMVDRENHRVMFSDLPFTYVVSMKRR